jgi:hypothetical protein
MAAAVVAALVTGTHVTASMERYGGQPWECFMCLAWFSRVVEWLVPIGALLDSERY